MSKRGGIPNVSFFLEATGVGCFFSFDMSMANLGDGRRRREDMDMGEGRNQIKINGPVLKNKKK